MKMEFKLDAHKAELDGSKIEIMKEEPEYAYAPYIRITLSDNKGCLFLYAVELEKFAVNILKTLKSKHLK